MSASFGHEKRRVATRVTRVHTPNVVAVCIRGANGEELDVGTKSGAAHELERIARDSEYRAARLMEQALFIRTGIDLLAQEPDHGDVQLTIDRLLADREELVKQCRLALAHNADAPAGALEPEAIQQADANLDAWDRAFGPRLIELKGAIGWKSKN